MSLLVDVVCDDDHPQCFHGPTLLFRRKGDNNSEFYACSACRNRKDCQFYLEARDRQQQTMPAQSKREILRRKEAVGKISYRKNAQLRRELKQIDAKLRGYCHTCSQLYDTRQPLEHSEGCETRVGLTDRQLKYPTEICPPKENDKVEAQYLFSKQSAALVVKCIQDLGVERVICLGTPRLHEILLNETHIKSLLLDIDPKYHFFYPRSKFIWYNMFNHFTMDESRQSDLEGIIGSDGRLAILVDPPFGGRVEPIARTLQKISSQYKINNKEKQDPAILWFFPYFMERHIQDSLPEMRMLDLQVNYENHAVFSEAGPRRRKAGSPVRIFTNVQLSLFDLSGVPGYRMCRQCGFWVSESNRHCVKCTACTSKNGMTYKHCDKCAICVKPSYEHCVACKRCLLPNHVCGEFKPDTSCYHCHLPGHKRSNCPDINSRKSKRAKRKK